ncbi:MAG: prepilin peptidase [Blastochloris sp.]|nr:prepilin peptidase [Blastochloris sp.]
MDTILNYIAPFLFGACLGSFLNVCIYRMPLNRSVVAPRSRCAACGIPLPWQHNLPIPAWFLLRGRCSCQLTKLSFRYPLVEALTALLTVWIWNSHSPALALVYIVFSYALIVATFIDIDHFIIPDEISLGGCLAGLLASFLLPELQGTQFHFQALLNSLLGLLFGGGLLLGIAVIGTFLLRKDAMGMGDVKLIAAMGAFFGWQAPLFIIAVSSVAGSVIGIGMMIQQQKRLGFGLKMPFGPFLALAAILWMLGGKLWMENYLAIFQN